MIQSEIVTILNEVLKQSAKLRKGGIQATYHCPACADKNLFTRKLEIAIDGPNIGSYHCWRCNWKGRSFGSLLSKLKAPQKYRDQIHKLTGDIRILRKTTVNKFLDGTLTLPEEFQPMYITNPSPEWKNAMWYLKRRNITMEDICRYNIGYCESGPYENHIIIPSYDAEGKLNFFIGRRYYTTKGVIPHKKPETPMNIIGFESFINWNSDIGISLVEGSFDAIAVRNNAIPLFGKYLQPKLLTALEVNKVKRVNIILDNDAFNDAIENYKRLKRLNGNIKIHVIKLDGKDPSVLGYTKIHTLIRESKPFEFEDLIRYKIGM